MSFSSAPSAASKVLRFVGAKSAPEVAGVSLRGATQLLDLNKAKNAPQEEMSDDLGPGTYGAKGARPPPASPSSVSRPRPLHGWLSLCSK